MADGDWTDEPGGLDERRRERLARREVRRRQLRRQRQLAAGALAAVGVVVVVVAIGAGGSGDGRDGASASSGARRARSTSTGTSGARNSRGTPTGQRADRETEDGGSAAGPVRNATPQPDWTPHTGPVPILEYHELGPAPADAPYPELYVSRPDFHREMDWLDDRGFQAVTLETVEKAWFDGGTLPAKPVVVSFDDGYRPQFTYALPELRRHGWPGVLNLKAEGSDLYGSEVRAMIAAGWELAAHSIHHLDLTTLDAAQLEEETAGAREILRREYGVPVKDYCYPAGRYDETVIAAVAAAGFSGATTEVRGYADREAPYELARFEVLGSDGVDGVAADLAAG
jgi:peptidoglycan/xylan/chitin deacetylase (PgdA/CDA1 family)